MKHSLLVLLLLTTQVWAGDLEVTQWSIAVRDELRTVEHPDSFEVESLGVTIALGWVASTINEIELLAAEDGIKLTKDQHRQIEAIALRCASPAVIKRAWQFAIAANLGPLPGTKEMYHIIDKACKEITAQ